MKRTCLECGETYRGRIDKKFCSDCCRNAYHNRQNGEHSNQMRRTNAILRRNRRILADLRAQGAPRVHRDQLLSLGFRFHYFTCLQPAPPGASGFFCYEHGLVPEVDDWFVLVSQSA